ncbi:MAG TPA: hypothetical protein PKX00_22085 [Opitutaceae bacterium]|nr:hypothetical protein [Opitutaceae bacterium]
MDLPDPSQGYPFPKLRIVVDEAFAGRVIHRLGGTGFDGTQAFPDGVKPVDFLVCDHALEFKTIEQEPLTHAGRADKLAELASEAVRKGEAPTDGHAVFLTGAPSKEYWKKFVGVVVRRQLETAAKQIKSTRAFLGRELRGAVFLVNQGAPFIDPVSFPLLIEHHRRDFADAIDIVFYLSLIPGFSPERPDKAVIPVGFEPTTEEPNEFADAFLSALNAEVSIALGKSVKQESTVGHTVHPVRFPLILPLAKGGSIRIH